MQALLWQPGYSSHERLSSQEAEANAGAVQQALANEGAHVEHHV